MRIGGREVVKQASSRCATEAGGAAGMFFVLTQQTFVSNRRLEGGEMKHRALPHHIPSGELYGATELFGRFLRDKWRGTCHKGWQLVVVLAREIVPKMDDFQEVRVRRTYVILVGTR